MSDRTLPWSRRARDWSPPEGWTAITTVDAHTAGEPLRVVVDGFPELPGETILDRRRYAREHLDDLRTALMWEPRGHADMYGCIPTPPVSPDADFGVLFTHNEGYSTMCGHGIIAVATVVLETGVLAAESPETALGIDTPAGLVRVRARVEAAGAGEAAAAADRAASDAAGRATRGAAAAGESRAGIARVQTVTFRNVPSFVVALDEEVDVPGIGRVRYDLAFGGAFYAYVRAEDVGLEIAPENTRALVDAGMAVKRAVAAARPIRHPFEEDLGFLYGTIFTGPPVGDDAHSRNVCIFAEGEVDRSPTGTGVSGRVAIHRARGELDVGDPIVVQSIIGTRFTGRVVEETRFGPYDAVVPEVEGSAYITGRHEFVVDPADPLGEGFLLR